MAYDEQLAARIRELIGRERGVTEQKMFGGLAFLVGGNMAIAASGQGGLLVRVDPDGCASTPADVATTRGLERWVERGTAYARSLPSKR